MAVIIKKQVLPGNRITFGHIVDIFLRLQDLWSGRQGFDRVLHVKADLSLAFLTSGFGGHEHDTVSGLCTIDGGGCCIFQDLDILDIAGIQIADIAYKETVDDVQRIQ